MDITSILYPVISLSGLGILLGIGLSYAGKVFEVKEDPKITEINEVLPGANCGGCGYPGCGGLAKAIASGEAPVYACPVGGNDVAQKIAAIMGVSVAQTAPTSAFVRCKGTCEVAKQKYVYEGLNDCVMAFQLAGRGSKGCDYGCLGLGSCVKVCDFDAIHIIDGVAVVDEKKCVSCGKCAEICPKRLIEIIPTNKYAKVECFSRDAGRTVMQNCSVGCIGCKMCEKACPFEAIRVINNLAVINYSLCKNCGLCAKKCPKGIIKFDRPLPTPKKAVPNKETSEEPKEVKASEPKIEVSTENKEIKTEETKA